jgi:hypothetical protein
MKLTLQIGSTGKNLWFLPVVFWCTACQKNPLDGLSIMIDPRIMEYTFVLEIYDARTGGPLGQAQNLQIEFSGSLANEVLNNNGRRIYDIIDGRMSLGLHPRVQIPPSGEQILNIRFTATGYQEKRIKVKFSAQIPKNQWLPVALINTWAPPPGMAVTDTILTLGSDGTLMNNTLIQTGNIGLPGNHLQNISLSLPMGTRFILENGDTLSSFANLSIEILSFDALNPYSQSYFPGGFTPDGVQNVPGYAPLPSGANLYFVNAGFTSIELKSGEQFIQRFSQPVEIIMEMDPAILNPMTGNALQIGDSIPVWSYSNLSNRWTYETMGVIERNPVNAKQLVRHFTNHLSWFATAWYGNRCPSATQIVFNIPNYPPGIRDIFLIEFVKPGTNQLVHSGARFYTSMYNGETCYFYNSPAYNSNNQQIVMEAKVYNRARTELLGNSSILTCNQTSSVLLNLPAPFVCSLDVTGVCATKSYVRFRPSFPLYYKRTGSSETFTYLGYVANGNFTTIDIDSAGAYDFRSYFNGKTYDTSMVIDRRNFYYEIEMGDYCNNF